MFDSISSKLDHIFRTIKGTALISEKNIEDALRDVRMALLEADVNYKVTKAFLDRVKEKAMGEAVLKSVSPAQQFIKIMNDELTAFLGEAASPLKTERPVLIMMLGLQGSGKTTTAAKIASWLKKEHEISPTVLIGADTYRPAAKDQLRKLSEQLNMPFYTEEHNDAVEIAKNGYKFMREKGLEAAIFDTAGRLHIDGEMINELKRMKEIIPFTEILLVGDAMLGQEAVNVAKNFNEALGITGLVLTKMDGDARGGAALSMKYITDVPIKFIGTGEKIDRLERFHPDRIASRILGMGDVVSLVEKAQATITAEESKKMEQKIKKGSFTLQDFVDQLKALQSMGPMDEMLRMLPGGNQIQMPAGGIDEREIKRTEAIILSMTPKERNNPDIIEMKRRARIAKGSGTTPERVNKLIKQFTMMRKMMKKAGSNKRSFHGNRGGFPGMPGGFGF